MDRHAPSAPPRLTWRDPILWLVIGPPLAAVLGGIATVWIAYAHRDPLVDQGVRKVGVTWQQAERRDATPAGAAPAPDEDAAGDDDDG